MATATVPKDRIESSPAYAEAEARYRTIRDELADVEAELSGVNERAREARERAEASSQAEAIASGQQDPKDYHDDRAFSRARDVLERRRATLYHSMALAMGKIQTLAEELSLKALAAARPDRVRLLKRQLELVDALIAIGAEQNAFRAALAEKGVCTSAGNVEWPLFAQPEHFEPMRDKLHEWGKEQGLI